MLRYTCPYCEKHVLIADEEKDRQVKCPHCEMLGVAYGVNIRSTDVSDVPAGHLAERHHPGRPRPQPESHPSTPPPTPPSEASADPVPPPLPRPPALGGGSGQDAPDLGPNQLLRARVRRALSEHATGQAQHMGLLSAISGAIGCVMGLAIGASMCFFMLPAICAVLAFMFAAKADKLARQEPPSRGSASAVKMAVLGRILGGAAIVVGLAMLTAGC